jgi:hypothetical protein
MANNTRFIRTFRELFLSVFIILIFSNLIFEFVSYKGGAGRKAVPISYAAKSIRFYSCIKLMAQR